MGKFILLQHYISIYKYFYPGLHKVEWPLLKELRANGFNLMSLKCQEDNPGKQSLIQIEKVLLTTLYK